MYLTRSGARWMYQHRVPLDLQTALGSNPLRLILDVGKAMDARRQATMLAAAANREFARLRVRGMTMTHTTGQETDLRDEIIRVLEASLAEAQAVIAGKEQLLELAETRRLQDVRDTEVRVFTEWDDALKVDRERLSSSLNRYKALHPQILAALDELRTLKKQAGASDAVLAQITSLSEKIACMQGGIETVVERSAPKVLPLLSVGLQKYLEIKGPELKPHEGADSKYVTYTIPNAVRTFIAFAGDKPTNQYLPSDLERFTQALARLPANWSKLKMFRELGLKEAGDRNARLCEPSPTLSAQSIVRGYITPLKGALEWICRQHDVRSPFADGKTKAPKTARPKEVRNPLTLPQLNAVMAEASSQANPVDRWLPLLGFLTGARVADLINLQGKDVKRLTEHWTPAALAMLNEDDRPNGEAWLFDTTGDVVVGGKHIRRDAKNHISRRLIAAHPLLCELGFIEWARTRKGFVFDALHRHAKNPAAAASKRMARLFQMAGVKVNGSGQDVFHCLRHNAKDWLRDSGVGVHEIRPFRHGGLLTAGCAVGGEVEERRHQQVKFPRLGLGQIVLGGHHVGFTHLAACPGGQAHVRLVRVGAL